MKKIKIHLICATRPNFMKIAPLYHALKNESWCEPAIIHTGQHYDYQMSQVFFNDLRLPNPDFHLSSGSGTHAEQTASVMLAYEKLLHEYHPRLVVVVGDVNSTMAATIVAKKLHVPVAHLEAGLRSFDRTMPEEINRIVTDSICDYYWTPSIDADQNLLQEGIKPQQIKRVGNIMIDAYCMVQEKISEHCTPEKLGLDYKNYAVLTLHRPLNVDDCETFSKIIHEIGKIALAVVFPVHPRTRKNLEAIGELPTNIRLVEPMGYLEFMSLVSESKYVITDSGGLQEETTYLQIPCFTLRENTERPITITMGTNQLVNINNLLDNIQLPKIGKVPPLWDGNASYRIVEHLREIIL